MSDPHSSSQRSHPSNVFAMFPSKSLTAAPKIRSVRHNPRSQVVSDLQDAIALHGLTGLASTYDIVIAECGQIQTGARKGRQRLKITRRFDPTLYGLFRKDFYTTYTKWPDALFVGADDDRQILAAIEILKSRFRYVIYAENHRQWLIETLSTPPHSQSVSLPALLPAETSFSLRDVAEQLDRNFPALNRRYVLTGEFAVSDLVEFVSFKMFHEVYAGDVIATRHPFTVFRIASADTKPKFIARDNRTGALDDVLSDGPTLSAIIKDITDDAGEPPKRPCQKTHGNLATAET